MKQVKINYPLTFRAAILERNNAPLKVDKITFNGPLERGQALVHIYYSGICGKQIEEIRGTGGKDPFIPHMLGHEGSGIVLDIGPGVRKVCPGDHVVLHWMKGAGINSATPLYERRGQRINAGWVTTFNEYGVVSENRLTKLPKKTDLQAACLLGCAVTTGLGVIFNEAKPHPQDSIAVFGCGGVGLNVIQGARLAGAYPIIAVDIIRGALDKSIEFGATHKVSALSKDVVKEIRSVTKGKGAKFVIVATGGSKVIEIAGEASSIPGSVFLVGVPPYGSKIAVDVLSIHMGRRFFGSYGGGTEPDRDIPRYLKIYEKGLLKLEEQVSHTVGLDDINGAITSITSGKKFGRCRIRLRDN